MKKDKPSIDLNKKVIKPSWYVYPIPFFGSLSWQFVGRVKYEKTNFKDFKEPSLILSNHASMIDMANNFFVPFPHLTTWITSIEEFCGREWLMRHVGCFPKRKFTNDLPVLRRMYDVINKRHLNLTMFPETRFSFAGINERISPALGRFIKFLKCRVIIAKQFGNYLLSPQWAKHPYRGNSVKVVSTCIVTKEEALTLSAEEIQARIEKAFEYDEYRYQVENNIKTPLKVRAEGIHQILYKCPYCGSEHHMTSYGSTIECKNCNTKWEMDELSLLHADKKENKFDYISDWYRWEREEAYKEVEAGTYSLETPILLTKFMNTKKNFVPIGDDLVLTHNMNGYEIKGKLYNGEDFYLKKEPLETESMHIEFDYKGTGNILDFATVDETWFVHPKSKDVNLMKFNFTTEALYDHFKNKGNK